MREATGKTGSGKGFASPFWDEGAKQKARSKGGSIGAGHKWDSKQASEAGKKGGKISRRRPRHQSS